MFSNLPFFFFFNDTATTEIYTLSLHDALPISSGTFEQVFASAGNGDIANSLGSRTEGVRSEEHTSELQSHSDLVCRLLLEKKKKSVCSILWSSKFISDTWNGEICIECI